MDRVEEAFDNYMSAATWFQETYGGAAAQRPADDGRPVALPPDFRIAYFSAEFGIHESVPVYSGGLGVLSGDHLKSASDLGLPLVGVGLMYREGYFRQYLTVDGWQQERYPENDFFNLPLIPEVKPRTARRCWSACRSPAARCRCASGASRSAACRSTCSTRTSRRTRRKTAPSPPASTAATWTCASARR